MTNRFLIALAKLGKILLVLFLIVLGLAVLDTFRQFSEIEDKIKQKDVDYSKLLHSNEENNEEIVLNEEDNNLKIIEGDGSNYALGTKEPVVTIVEFADFACPFCKESYPRIREVTLKYNKYVHYIFRDLPIITEYSDDLALAARCAGEQGLFWPMHDKLFQNQDDITDRDSIMTAARQVGTTMDRFEDCFDSQKYLAYIKKDYADAQSLGIATKGTPMWFIDGQEVAGNIPKDVLLKYIKNKIEAK